MLRQLRSFIERWPIAGGFTISRGTKTEAAVVLAEIEEDGIIGRGECVPYPRYGESVEGVQELVAAQSDAIASGISREELLERMPAGAARNAVDAALWALEARRSGQSVWQLAGLPEPQPVITAFTISLGTPESMAAAAARASARPLLKIKLGSEDDAARIRAVRAAAPQSQLIIDANEAWRPSTLETELAACAEAGVALVEQPLPADQDEALQGIQSPVPLCADESFHGLESLDQVASRYACVNVKLDKTGGLTAAIEVARAARTRGLELMLGCMVGTSLAMAPAFHLSAWASFVDLDGPLLLERDRSPGFAFEGSTMLPPTPGVWA
jgi:L-alanine-DL-glutamate epimerase-like enolase superfamily enzyme